jgi:rhomboid protease GluP
MEENNLPAGQPQPGPAPEFPPQEPAPRPAPVIQPAQGKAYLTYTILVLTILVYLGQEGTRLLFGVDIPAAFGAKINEEIIFYGQYWRLFTPMLLHGGLLHIGFNMYALSILGPELERHYGSGRFLLLYLLGGFGGNVVSMIFTEANSLGASTAIFGLFAAQGSFVYLNRELFGKRAGQILNRIIYLAAINFFIGLSPGIDNWGHLGGFVGGLLFSYFAGPRLVVEGIYPSYRLRDTRSLDQAVIVGLGVGLLFAALAIWGILFRWS